jgi:leucyl aminopeptidase
MVLALASAEIGKAAIETLIVPVCADKEIHADRAIVAFLKKAKKLKEFGGEKDEEIVFYKPSGLGVDRVICLGMGKGEGVDSETLRAMAGKATKRCIQMKLDAVYFLAPAFQKIGLDQLLMLEALMEGICLGNHLFDKYLKEKKQKPLKNAYLLVDGPAVEKYGRLPARVETICAGAVLARDWVNLPPNDKRPEQFADLIRAQARKVWLAVRILPESELKQKGFGALLAVGAGSQSRPANGRHGI